MDTNRRQFLERLGATTAALAVLPAPVGAFAHALGASSVAGGEPNAQWDTTWVRRLTGKYRALFDVPEVESGYGVWRATIWAKQYADVLKAPAREMSSAVVLRHNAIVLAMQQSFWDKYDIGKAKAVTHPLTLKPTDRNPVLLDETSGIPAPFSRAGVHKQLARGVVVLACNLALQDCVEQIKAKDGLDQEAAHKAAVAQLIPGVILQPSGVFAAILAQESGCSYVRSS